MKGKGKQAFWDSSALAPLFFRDTHSARSRRQLRWFPEMTVWWGTIAEIHGAVIQMLKERHISPEGAEKALTHLDQFRLRWREILPIEKIRELAEVSLDRYRIRSADALQLAAALVWCKEHPDGRLFVCFDSELSEAARQSLSENLCGAIDLPGQEQLVAPTPGSKI